MAETQSVKRNYQIFKIVGIYAIIGLIYIYTSDTILDFFITDHEIGTVVSIFKGSAFIILTSLLLFILIKLYDNKTRLSEQQVLASEKRFKLLFQKVADPVYIADTHGRMISANDHACHELGYTLEEIQQLHLVDIDATPNIHEVVAAQLPALKNASITFESNHRRKDGSVFPVELKVGLIDLDGQPSLMGVARDISKRKRIGDCLAFLAHATTVHDEENFFTDWLDSWRTVWKWSVSASTSSNRAISRPGPWRFSSTANLRTMSPKR